MRQVMHSRVFDGVDEPNGRNGQLRGIETFKLKVPSFDDIGCVVRYYGWED